jgi:vancomycin resistance protein VanW
MKNSNTQYRRLKPINRSKFRIWTGKKYYTLSRYMLWCSGRFKFAHIKSTQNLEYVCFTHRTPLLRELKDIEMKYQYNKIINLKLAVKKLDGILIRPGEMISYWRLIGKPTARKGYVPGMVLYCGAYKIGMGGGLCQLSNLVYWMTLHTSLTVVERYRHSYDVFPDSDRTQPFGSGATCVYPYRDLMIRNDMDFDFQLRVKVEQSYLEGKWLSNTPPDYRYEIIEKNHQFQGEYWGGFSRHNEIYRKQYTISGDFINEEYITENNAIMMYTPFLPSSIGVSKDID